MKATLIKTNLLLALLLFMYGCGNKEFREMYSEFKTDLENGNIEAVKLICVKFLIHQSILVPICRKVF